MEIHWKSQKIQTYLMDESQIQADFDKKVKIKLYQRLTQLSSVSCLAEMPRSARTHPIRKGKIIEFYALDLPHIGGGKGKWRLKVKPTGEYDIENLSTITEVIIIGIVDYH